MAAGVTASFKNSNVKQEAKLEDAATGTGATVNGPVVAVTPTSSTGKHTLFIVTSGFTGTSFTVQLQHSVDGTNFADVGSASTAISSNTTTALTVSGPVARYVRVKIANNAVTAVTRTIYDYVSAN